MKNSKLAFFGGKKSVTIKHPHFSWPPLPDKSELEDLTKQRRNDISIKGRSGPIKEFEDLFIAYMGRKLKYAITFNSGTSALLVAYFALGIKPKDEIIVPALTFHAAVSPMLFLGGVPVMVDVNRDTWCVNENLIEAKITKKTRAITVVHQWGHPAEMNKIMRIARKYKLKVIEDCSHAHGSKYKGEKVGTFGDVSIFSLQAAKILFSGEGGILLTNDEEIKDKTTLLGHYRDRARDEIDDKNYQRFWQSGFGLKLRMSPYNAITAIHSLKKIDSRIKERKKSLEYFSSNLSTLPEITAPSVRKGMEMGAWYGYKPIYNKNKFADISRDIYIKVLAAEGVEVKTPGSPPLYELPLYDSTNKYSGFNSLFPIYKKKDYPNAEFLSQSALSLPTFTDWPSSRKIIDQYLLAFNKIHGNIEQIKYI